MKDSAKKHIPVRERNAIVKSLRAGVTPKTGIQRMVVGRGRELEAISRELDAMAEGTPFFRIIIGEFGAGKSFFLQLARSVATDRDIVTLHADLSPERRLFGTGGQPKKLYAELLRNCATRTRSANALTSIVERFITECRKTAKKEGIDTSRVINAKLENLREFLGGYDFAAVVDAYWRGFDSDNEQLKSDAVRWLRGEFATKIEAKAALGVRTIVDDDNVYERLKLLAAFVRQAGYGGLMICLDEMVNLYKLAMQKSRESNYEKILSILNDCLQGGAEHIGFLLGGTPEFLRDERKGLYSYEALRSRLEENTFTRDAGVTDYDATVLELSNLTREDMLVLLRKLRDIYASGNPEKYPVPDEALEAFLRHCFKNIGGACIRTPRNTIKEFLNFLAFLDQEKDTDWRRILDEVEVEKESNSDMPEVGGEGGSDSENFGVFTL